MSDSLLSFDGVRFRYGKRGKAAKYVLDGLTFSANGGEIVAVMGSNGSGKTTILNIASGLSDGYEGSVRIRGRECRDMKIASRSKEIAYVGQSDAFVPNYYGVRDFVLEGRRPFVRFGKYGKSDIEIANESLRMMDLENFRDRRVSEMSGGERQRAVIARALAKRAGIYLLDEPCSAMDVSNHARFFDVLRKIRDNGALVVLTIHDINLAVRNCDKALVLEGGATAYCGDVSSLGADVLSRAYGIGFGRIDVNGNSFFWPVEFMKREQTTE